MSDSPRQSEVTTPTSQSPRKVLVTTALAVIPLIALIIWLQSQPEDTDKPVEPLVASSSTATSSAASSAQVTAQSKSSISSQESSASVSSVAKPVVKKPQLPSLDNSDPAIKTSLAQANGSDLIPLLSQEFILRKAVRAIALMAEGGLVAQYRPLNSPMEAFQTQKNGEKIAIAAENFDRYTPYLDAAEAVGPEALAGLYNLYYPLLEKAHAELGSKSKKSFKALTIEAIDLMLAAPESKENLPLKQPTVMYLYTDPKLESLTQTQKLMLRIGPENQARLKKLLMAIKANLDS